MKLQVQIPYSGGVQTYKIKTPSQRKSIKRLARRSYKSMASGLVNSPTTGQNIVSRLTFNIRDEMKAISSQSYNSLLRDSVEAIKNFWWETVWQEMLKKMPTLMLLLSQIVGQVEDRHPMLCLIASMIIKSRHQHMSLVQRVVSVMLYGNGTAKQVCVKL